MSLILWIRSRLLHLQTPEGSGSGGRIPLFLLHFQTPEGSGGSSPTLTSDLKVWGFSPTGLGVFFHTLTSDPTGLGVFFHTLTSDPTGLGVSGVHVSLIQTNNGC
jgi:hypothetical protein